MRTSGENEGRLSLLRLSPSVSTRIYFSFCAPPILLSPLSERVEQVTVERVEQVTAERVEQVVAERHVGQVTAERRVERVIAERVEQVTASFEMNTDHILPQTFVTSEN